MQVRRWHVTGLLAIALPAFWLLLAGPERVLGFDTGKLGMVLLVTSAWTSLLALSQLPRGEDEATVSPGEWKAWIGLGFMLAATAYFLARLHLFAGESFPHAPLSSGVARNLVMLLVAWVVLSQVVATRWKGRVQEDERDREIEANAAEWGRGGLVFCVIGVAVLLGFSPAERLQWATPFMVANLLVFALMWGWLVEYAATVAMYWRDRRTTQ